MEIQEEMSFTNISNRILDEANLKLVGSEFKIFMLICRETYGRDKHRNSISISQMVQATGLVKTTVISAIHQLVQKEYIKKFDQGIIHEYQVVKSNQPNFGSSEKQPETVQESNQEEVQKSVTEENAAKNQKNSGVVILDSLKMA